MPHYANGDESKIGDRVRGRGYNERGNDGRLRELDGVLVSITPDAQACNCQVAFVRPAKLVPWTVAGETVLMPERGAIAVGRGFVVVDVDYGQCDHFLRV